MSEDSLIDSPSLLHADEHAINHIAIIGMAGRFARANSLAAFWENLAAAVDAVSMFLPEELEASGISPSLLRRSNYVPAKYVLDDPELFDAEFFGYSNSEARLIDPQQRLFLELAYLALEHGGYHSAGFAGSIGVFGCTSAESYLWRNVFANAEVRAHANLMQKLISNFRDFVATRTSYKLGLTGPSLTIQSACSSSLVTVHVACQSLLNFECDMALAGGVSITNPIKDGYLYVEGGIGSPDAACRAFDKKAQGCVAGNGGGVVLLKRLSDALADGDTIHAVIRGTAINNDGSAKAGFTAPSARGQADVIARAHAVAGVSSETIGYMEAHGTGTQLGDPIEIDALTRAFRTSTDRNGFCALASVKTNIGHLDAAAGIAGLLKTCLVLSHQQIPASLHFETPNPKIDFEASPFFVNTTLREWKPTAEHPRRAAISSFGMGGTNAHAVLEEAPTQRCLSRSASSWQVLVLSGRSAAVLQQMRKDLLAQITSDPHFNLADAAYTLQVGRPTFAHRFAAVVHDPEEAVAALRGELPDRTIDHMERLADRPVALSFSGLPVRVWGAGVYAQHAGFREAVNAVWPRVLKTLGGGAGTPPDLGSSSLPARSLDFIAAYSAARLALSHGIRANAFRGIPFSDPLLAALAEETTLPEQVVRAQDSVRTTQQDAAETEAVVLEVATCGLWSPTASAHSSWQIVAGLWAQGATLDWDRVHVGRTRRRVPLPAYPFERKRHWVDPDRKVAVTRTQDQPAMQQGKTAEPLIAVASATDATPEPLFHVFEEQLNIMSRQLDMLAGGPSR